MVKFGSRAKTYQTGLKENPFYQKRYSGASPMQQFEFGANE